MKRTLDEYNKKLMKEKREVKKYKSASTKKIT